MKLLSIDVGIKNLAYCLLDKDKIISWDVINLCGKDPICTECKKTAKFAQAEQTQAEQTQAEQTQALEQKQVYFCATHAKKSGLLLPNSTISLKKIKKMKVSDLQKVISDYSIAIGNAIKKEDLLKAVVMFMEQKMLITVSSAKANEMDLVQIGIAMRKAFNTELKDHLSSITHIAIENQISPIANRMKTLQGMIAQYFIMHDKTQIAFVSAANKLKGHQDIETDLTTYASRKKEGIIVTLKLINERYSEWIEHFTKHKKKDDLADAFLQGNWFLKNIQ
jgi:hypothetical protein